MDDIRNYLAYFIEFIDDIPFSDLDDQVKSCINQNKRLKKAIVRTTCSDLCGYNIIQVLCVGGSKLDWQSIRCDRVRFTEIDSVLAIKLIKMFNSNIEIG